LRSSDLDTLEGIDWDNFGFGLRHTDFMYVMKGDLEGNWQKGELQPYGNLEVSPAAGVLNYGQVSWILRALFVFVRSLNS